MSSDYAPYFDDRRFDNRLVNSRINDLIECRIHYKDNHQDLNKEDFMKCSSTNTICDVVKQFLKNANLHNISYHNVLLVAIGTDQRRITAPLFNIFKTLDDLKIRDGYTLYFESSATISSLKFSNLFIWGPGLAGKKEYEWDKSKTTLQMLLEYVIKVFSLESIERERIHLFMNSEELDLASNFEKLLIDLGVNDYSFIDVEIIPPCPLSYTYTSTMKIKEKYSVLDNNENMNDLSLGEPSLNIELKLVYTDHNSDLTRSANIKLSSATTIRDIAKKFLKIIDLDHMEPEKIALVKFGMVNKRTLVSSLNDYTTSNDCTTLNDLNIKQGYTLYFEPSPSFSTLEPYHLKIWAPNYTSILELEWNKTTTTLEMLLEHIIKSFSLESIERERIHLLALNDNELDIASNSNKLLSELGIINNKSIFVQIVPSGSSSIVHVKCIHDTEVQLFDVHQTITIKQLKDLIGKKFKDHYLVDFKLLNHINEEINLSDTNRTLVSLGVTADQTIYATFHLHTSNNRISILDMPSRAAPRCSSLISKYQPDDVKVIFKVSSTDSVTIEMSVDDTVDDLIKSIAAIRNNQLLPQLKISCGSIIIDDKESIRRLIDFGIKRGNVITVDAIAETPPIDYLTRENRTSTLCTSIKNMETSRFPIKPVGLSNLGNTCYMNSALQCLAHTKPLTQFFLDGLAQDSSDYSKSTDIEWNSFYIIGTVTGAYADLLRNLWLPEKTSSYYYSFRPTHIKEILGLKAPRFATWEQQDTQEFLIFLLDEIHQELKEKNNNGSNNIIEVLFFGKIQSIITCLDCQHQEKMINPNCFLSLPIVQQERQFVVTFISKYGSNETVLIKTPENGHVKNLVESFVETTYHYLTSNVAVMANDEYLDFEMPLNQLSTTEVIFIEKDGFSSSLSFNRFDKRSKKLTLEGCLREFCSVERLEDSWLCQHEKCKKNTRATKQLQLYSLPTILIVQFKRFTHENGLRQKIDTFVDYPINGLDLSDFLSSSEKVIYDLFAVSNHIGSIYGGHYTACARHEINGKSEWYKFDDSYVSSFCCDNDIVSSDAYLLFYIKRDNFKH